MSKASYALQPLVIEEITGSEGFTHMATVTAGDLTTTATNTAMAFILGPIAAGNQVLAEMRVRIPLQDISDAAFNSDTISIGDDASATSLLAATQTNYNGTVVPVAAGTLSTVYAAASHIKVTVNSMAAKALNDLDKGEIQFFFKIRNVSALGDLKTTASIAK